jgi:MFS family permease
MTINRWLILCVLFFARFTMAFQFQSIGALSPLIAENYSAGLADIGLLIGLYLAPGVIVAIPGGAVAGRFGDKRVVALGMTMMLIGGTVPGLVSDWNMLVASRLLAGAGGVILNVVMTKMLFDWFVGREISTAMAIFVNSWPVGIAISLFTLPLFAEAHGLAPAWWAVIWVILAGLLLLLLFYRPPSGAAVATTRIRASQLPVYALVLASTIWALYNTALAMVFSFGPALLNEQGWTPTAAGSAIGAFMVVFSVALPVGGVLADRTGHRDAIIFVSLASFAVLMPFVPYLSPAAITLVFLIVGGLFALAAGPIMTLPSAILSPQSRTFGMGVFFSVYYGAMMVAPRIAGGMADRAGNAGVAFFVGAVMSVASIGALALFRRVSAVRAPAV